MKQCFAYIRVSTVKQGDGVSLDAQRDAIIAFAKRHDIFIKGWYQETVTAAKKGRPEFNRLVVALKRRHADGVIFHKIDRSARNFADWAKIGELSDAGVGIHFVSESLDFQSRGGRMAADIQAVVAADYIRNLREESIKGQLGRLKEGIYPYTAPVGYLDTGAGKAKAVDPAKAPLIQKLFELYSSGQYSFDSLAAEMRRRGLKHTKGALISATGIEVILKNPFYMGVILIKATGRSYLGVHKPIISANLFAQAEAVRTGRRRKVKVSHDYEFRGMFRCGHCDRAMIGERQRGHVYYRCQGKGCPTKTVREEALADVVKSHLSEVSLSKTEVDVIRKKFQTQRSAEDEQAQRKVAKMEVAKIADRLSRLTDKFIDDLIDEETYNAKRLGLLEDQKRLSNIIDQSAENHDFRREVERLLEHTKNLYSHYLLAPLNQKRAILNFASSNMRVFGKKVALEPPNWYGQCQKALNPSTSAHELDPTRTLSELINASNADLFADRD